MNSDLLDRRDFALGSKRGKKARANTGRLECALGGLWALVGCVRVHIASFFMLCPVFPQLFGMRACAHVRRDPVCGGAVLLNESDGNLGVGPWAACACLWKQERARGRREYRTNDIVGASRAVQRKSAWASSGRRWGRHSTEAPGPDRGAPTRGSAATVTRVLVVVPARAQRKRPPGRSTRARPDDHALPLSFGSTGNRPKTALGTVPSGLFSSRFVCRSRAGVSTRGTPALASETDKRAKTKGRRENTE